MKKFFILFLMTFAAVFSFAQNKKYDKLISEFDVIEYVESLEKNRPDLFWDAVWRNNDGLHRLAEAIEKGKETAVQAQHDLYYAQVSSAGYYQNLPINSKLQFAADSLLKYIGINSVYDGATIQIVDFEEVNAFACPNGEMYITTGAMMSDGIPLEGMIGICAHEAAHFLLQHSLANAYALRNKEKKNMIIAGVVSAIDAAANAYAQANGAVGNESWDNVNERIESNIIWAGDNALKYKYKYSREQEIEADIIAYRFLEYMGWGGEHYINALKSIGYENDAYYDDMSDHPTTEFRVKLLEHLGSKQILQ